MKIIYDNIIYSLQAAGGISAYWSEIIKRSKIEKTKFYDLKNNNIFRKSLAIPSKKESILPATILRFLPFYQKLTPKSIFHSSYYRTSMQENVVKIITVHDFIRDRQDFNLFSLIYIIFRNLSIKKADGIICVSNNTRKDLIHFLPNIKKEKITTIYNGVGENFFRIQNIRKKIKDKKIKIFKNKKILLYVGDRKSKHKNFGLAIEVTEDLKECVLLCIGGGKLSYTEKKIINLKIKNRFYHLDQIQNDELNIIYNLSFCLLYPSLYEGFGIPIIEAMRAGCPVISTNTSSIPEIAKSNAVLVKHIDKVSFVKAVRSLEKKKFRYNLIKKGLNHSKKFSWEKCYKKTLKFYSDVYEKKFKEKIDLKKDIKTKTLISFIMTAKNSEKYISDSILELQKENDILWELIIVDDHSSDKTLYIAKKFEKKDKRIKVFKNKKKGKVNATNYGYNFCKGETIKCIDSDDILEQEYFRYYKKFKNYKAHCHNAFITDNKLKKIIKYSVNPRLLYKEYDIVLSELLSFPKWAWSFNRQIAEKIFPMPEDLPFEDIWINLIIKKHCKEIFYIKKPIYMYRQHNTQTFGGILNFDKEKVIFRAKRMLKLIKIIKQQPRIYGSSKTDYFKNMESYWKLMSVEDLSYANIFKAQQKFIEKLKIFLIKRNPVMSKYAIYLKWKFDGLFKN